jgi:hypothetical protein
MVKKERGEDPDVPENIQWLCANCDEDKTIEDWKDPESHRNLAMVAIKAREVNARPEVKALVGAASKVYHNQPEVLQTKSARALAKWSDPAYRSTKAYREQFELDQ